ncbi:TonB-dependent siderophore receptor [Pseudomonas akapageensis]|uniref:TonB-dependent siderophore receptor n=1 Tax=Pseudomonas akapageensis TaxID=2609961 RepID=UPI00140D9D7B|nr:TonB-dependent siderophore receptor [Pseudomonas akapageensis]
MKLGLRVGKQARKHGVGAITSHWLGLGAATALSSLLPLAVVHAQDGADKSTKDYVELAPSSVKANAVEDTGYVAKEAPGITKSNVPLIENPQSVTVVTRKQMDAQDAQNLSEALRYTAGVNSEPFGADNRNDYIYIRGFDQSNDGLFLDGLNLLNRNYGMWRVDPYSLESVEVVRGPSSVLFGQSSPGGLVNQVSKRPTEVPIHEVRAEYGSYDKKIGAFDIGGKLDDDGRFLGRLTAQVKDGSTQIDHVDEDSWFIAPALTWNINDDTSLTILTQVQHERLGSVFQYLPYEGTVKKNPLGRYDADLFVGEPDFDHFDRDQESIGYSFDHAFNDVWSFKQNFRYRHLKLDYKTVFGLGYFNPAPTADLAPEDFAQGFRGALTSKTKVTGWALDNQFLAQFNTGAVEHNVTMGGDLQYTTYDIFNQSSPGGDPNPFDFFNPVYGNFTPSDLETTNDLTSDVRQLGAYLQDQFKVDKFVFTLGGRVDWARVTQDVNGGTGVFEASNPAGSAERNDRKATGRAGVVYLADNGLAPYYSYSQSFAPTVGLTTEIMKPTTGEQHEVGIKYQPRGSNSSVTLSAFDLRKQDVPTLDPNDPTGQRQIQIGEVKSRGVELEAIASFSDEFNVITNLTYNKVEITKDTNFEGNRPFNVPEKMGSIWADYTFQSGEVKGLGFGAGVRYVGSSFGDDANRLDIPGYTLVDAMVHYQLENWRVQLNAKNVFDKEYATCQNGEFRCNYGYPRMISTSVSYDW